MNVESILEKLGMSTYQAKALISILKCGEAKASEISELSGIPRAKIYEVLDQLSDLGLVDKIPTRPVRFRARKPEEIAERLRRNITLEYEGKIGFYEAVQKDLVGELASVYSPSSIHSKELIRVIRVGEASERETRMMYSESQREINIVSRSFEYYPKVRKELVDADKRGVEIKILLLGREFTDERTRKVQTEIVKMIKSDIDAEIRSSKTPLPLRGSIVDPSYDYRTGKAIFVVEDPEIPLYLRDAAVTENPSLVAGMKKYFDLIWKYESYKI
ncbi:MULTISPECIES: TrmB family transcriptional regulator [unclassified Archaeoglobus]|uniref:TrmB family transcriptional regulator n=1 Tax=unclassified Archaeoglobus TaxID=2643606 RepID=UPI0025BFF226|nr:MULTISPECIES: helix-turn-helix domain-containing protein [unclassified Archaeoglobus]